MSCSKNAKNSFAPEPVSSATFVVVGAAAVARVGSSASYAARSEARSVGAEGGLGAEGAAKGFTTPT